MRAKATFVLVMLIFGSLGLFVKNINLSSSEIALFRGAIGSVFLIGASIFIKQKVNVKLISKRNVILLILSGSAMGFNWIFLFEAYRFTTIPNSTLSYYFAPIFVMVLAPFLLKEKWTTKKAISILFGFVGLFLVIQPGVVEISGNYNHPVGIGYGLLAAGLYASVILINKFIRNLSGFQTTIMQLSIATIVMFPYVLMTQEMDYSGIDMTSVLLIAIFGIVHTGIAYLLYFSSMKKLKAQTIAVLSYIDPISAVVFATLFLNENMTAVQMLGGALILGGTLLSEISVKSWKRGIKKVI
ncbi:DMT family transporter [Paucisalibacillus globulus]|uniref:DMT family transporter n=1 Tax=Paucisalibacillus globulus TaxID=351095 RepID=UPI00042A7161|nr:DMT family transporter [Paucisalibacillus globulus]